MSPKPRFAQFERTETTYQRNNQRVVVTLPFLFLNFSTPQPEQSGDSDDGNASYTESQKASGIVRSGMGPVVIDL